EKCEEIAFKWRENVIIAKDGESVIGFICYGGLTPEDSVNGGIVALYVLSEYYGKGVGLMLMNAAMEKLSACPKVGVWVLTENKRAIRFYEKCGFRRDGEEIANANISASEIRMIYQR
ncbi:MAG: GNAT family N-acetyltransferase, partial [Clostridia bacterium]|nr:GNAT family N-acetyltransferase [Clostridia bacterium]